MIHSIPRKALKKLIKNQKDFASAAPVTSRATFKLQNILDLINEIKQNPKFQKDNDSLHNICITFVRLECDISSSPKKLKTNELGFLDTKGLIANATTKNGKRCTQVIPIITGCVLDLKRGTFKYLKNRKGIPYVRPGGESSGLIPPPPPKDDDFS